MLCSPLRSLNASATAPCLPSAQHGRLPRSGFVLRAAPAVKRPVGTAPIAAVQPRVAPTRKRTSRPVPRAGLARYPAFASGTARRLWDIPSGCPRADGPALKFCPLRGDNVGAEWHHLRNEEFLKHGLHGR